ncbi:MAG TPA: alpha/beta hydrolase [Anaerolineaceae bacterium]|jgi:pimeloyl-ACP methyl ester carboxylesterase
MPVDPISHLYFEASGPECAPTIVFLHGGGGAGWMWRRQVAGLQGEYRCLAPDLPEQGQTSSAGAYSPEAAADCVAALIRSQVPGEKAHIVGLSEGAQVTVALLGRCPQVIDHALVSSAILLPILGMDWVSPGLLAWSYRIFMAPLKNADWWIRINMKGSAGIPDEYFPEFKASFQQTSEAGLIHMLQSSLSFRQPAGLEKANVPVLVVAGRKEYREMRLSAQQLVRALPCAQGRFLSLGPCSSLRKEHNWAMTAPDLFNQTVRAWIEGRPLPLALVPFDAQTKV